jgi:ribosome maturation factor RimP
MFFCKEWANPTLSHYIIKKRMTMAKRKIEEIVAEVALSVTDKNSFELVDVEFIKEGSNWYLRVYIDKPGGIVIEDCQTISEQLSEKLDDLDPIEQSYYLEVSSPGLERPLKKDRDFVKFKGELVEVKLFQPIEGKKAFEGELIGLIDNNIGIKTQKGLELMFERDKVSSVKRVLKF